MSLPEDGLLCHKFRRSLQALIILNLIISIILILVSVQWMCLTYSAIWSVIFVPNCVCVVRFKVLTVLKTTAFLFWVVTPYRLPCFGYSIVSEKLVFAIFKAVYSVSNYCKYIRIGLSGYVYMFILSCIGARAYLLWPATLQVNTCFISDWCLLLALSKHVLCRPRWTNCIDTSLLLHSVRHDGIPVLFSEV
jgi:hypothetical protein